jgi:hypothetical protein
MSDIPDWLVELAAQRDDEDSDDEGLLEWDFLRPGASIDEAAAAPDVEPITEPAAGFSEWMETSPEATAALDEDALIGTLRSEVEAHEEEVARLSPPPERARSGRLLPWQQFVLALLLLIDVIIIGLFLLVMFGRISFG